MLFNSYEFIFLFLPVTYLVFIGVGRKGHYKAAMAWLIAASLFYYGWWNPAYLGLILGSVIFNYAVGITLNKHTEKASKGLLVFGVCANLLLLGYYKYANFFLDSISAHTDTSFQVESIILPLAISFFTFQQIAYLVDASRGECKEYDFIRYCLFVTFFPQLIAGPIVHHKEMLPQFMNKNTYIWNNENLAVGITIFVIGLFKKVVIADNMAAYATPVFIAAEAGDVLSFYDAWGGALAYTFQLYFDFSGYSDMAIGIARMFGIILPINFYSPYKAVNIIDFWRRWHITLSRFLRDYIYIPLGGNRKGKARRYMNLMITMVLGGLWHGAGWTFVAWGVLHGGYLVINHAWRFILRKMGVAGRGSRLGEFISRSLTLAAVVVAWVVFRADTFEGATVILSSMFNLEVFNQSVVFSEMQYFSLKELALLFFLLCVVWFFPNSAQLMRGYKPVLESYKGQIEMIYWTWIEWKPSLAWGVIMAVITLFSLFYLVENTSEFLYYQF